MDEIIITYKVYALPDERDRILSVNSSAWLEDLTGWVEIDEGTEWPKYMHAQGNYFPKPIYTEDGIPRYKLEGGQAVERTAEEIEADRAAIPPAPPSDGERITALESNKADKTDVEALNVLLGVSEDGR